MTRQEIEQKMDELAREFAATHDPEIPEQIFELASRLRGWTTKKVRFTETRSAAISSARLCGGISSIVVSDTGSSSWLMVGFLSPNIFQESHCLFQWLYASIQITAL
jgi:hypothetical protein